MDSRALDMNAAYLGASRLQLMENAGRETAKAVLGYKNIAVFAGTGNNGGDGLVAARHLLAVGKSVRVFAIDGARTPDCQKNLDILLNSHKDVIYIRDSKDCESIRPALAGCDLVIDALVGVGIKGQLREPVKSLVDLMNSLKAFRLAVDIPSGDGTTKVNANKTISFHTPKTPDAVVVDIGIPLEAEKYCGPGDVWLAIPERKPESHKGDFGRVLVVGGSSRYAGAPYLAAWAAMRVGVDLSVVCAPKEVVERMPANPNLIVQPLKSKECINEDDVELILRQEYDAMVIGNGIGTDEGTKEAVLEILARSVKPVVVDAEALRMLKPSRIKPNMLLTPHTGEFKRLNEEYDESKREKQAEEYARKTKATLVLKGHIDVITDGLTTRLNATGNPGMTVGGTGDVLAGVIGGLLAQNKDALKSASAGAFLNGLAGDIAYAKLGVSMTATDVIDRLPAAIRQSLEYR
ncbi:MAG: NAD(P)H-hydrate dehydratase [Candidatus Altiarchaeota archaeon]|nr:NAD(P)H-hydrate dehydratase [Candidatus Altiarchaeota archaeon]